MENKIDYKHAYEVVSEKGNQKSIMLYGTKVTDPELGIMLTVTEEKDPDGTIWITTAGLEKSVSVNLGNPPLGLLKSPTFDEHRDMVMDMSINKWLEENGK